MDMKHKYILIIENDPDDAELTIKALKRKRIQNEIRWINNGPEAVDFILCKGKYSNRSESDLPLFIMLDLKMPGMDGHEVLKVLKNNPLSKKIPIIIFTSSNEPRDLDQSYSNGANSYIQKPIKSVEFDKVVKELGLYWAIVNKTE